MKKNLLLLFTLVLTAIAVFAVSFEHADATGVGTYQCANCGQIVRITHQSSQLPARDLFGDGHVHDWRYIGGLSGTIHPIR